MSLGKLPGPISTDKDHSGTSAGETNKSAKMENNSIKYTCWSRFCVYVCIYSFDSFEWMPLEINSFMKLILQLCINRFLTLLLSVHCAVDCVLLSGQSVFCHWLVHGRLSITAVRVFLHLTHWALQRQIKSHSVRFRKFNEKKKPFSAAVCLATAPMPLKSHYFIIVIILIIINNIYFNFS